jgi:ABC-type branched-subunit amino acid transport system ATPase component
MATLNAWSWQLHWPMSLYFTLMDEPTAGMAPQERNNLMALTKQLVQDRRSSAKGLAVLFTEHSMDVVFGYATVSLSWPVVN